MKSTVQILRETKNFTQSELAAKAGLSLRTVQRIEAGNIPKGFTLKTLADVFEVEPKILIPSTEIGEVERAKFINLSTLMRLVIPFGGIIFPLILIQKTSDPKNRAIGKSLLSMQIVLAVLLSVSLIVSPFLQKSSAFDFPIFLVPLLSFIVLRLLLFIINGNSLNKLNDLSKNLKINYL